MNMNTNLDQLKELKNKVEKLINLQQQLLKQNQQLQAINNQLVHKNQSQSSELTGLTEKIKVVKLAQQISGSDNNTRDIKLMINEYIREIDKCLGLINR